MTKQILCGVLVSFALTVAPCQAEQAGQFAPSTLASAAAPAAAFELATADTGNAAPLSLVPDIAQVAAHPDSAPIDFSHDLLPASADALRAPETAGVLDSEVAAPVKASDGTRPYADVWERIRDNFGLGATDNRRVTRQVEWFENHENYVGRLAERSRKYLHYIVEEVQKRGMPSEIALLPIVESAFDPQALSPANASGIWQFIPSTGKLYGLRQSWWYDGRRDIVAATNGALDYLEKLHAQFGAWDLALAAYNCGEGGVARAIERNQRAGRPTDYANLILPEETRNYVPKLIAAREIVADPEAHGLSLPPIPDVPYFTTVTTHKHIDLAVAARFAGLSESDFLALNPGYSRPLILAQDEQTILVPVDMADTFAARLNDPTAKLVSWSTHRLKRGESYASVASQFGMSSEELKRVNGIAAHRRLAGGGTILVRDAMADEGSLDKLSMSSAADAELAAPTETITFSHRVRRGESLAAIARRYNVGVASLRTWNRIPRSLGVRVGQMLIMHRTGEMGEPTLKAGLADATVMSSAGEGSGVAARAGSGAGAAASGAGVDASGPFESNLVEVAKKPGKHGKAHHHAGSKAKTGKRPPAVVGKEKSGAPAASAAAKSKPANS